MNEADPKGRSTDPAAAGNDPASSRPLEDAKPPMDIQAYIGTRLREVYNDVASQPIPDRFLDLMKQLDRS